MAGIFENLRKALKSNPFDRASKALGSDKGVGQKKHKPMNGMGPSMTKSHELQGGVSQGDDAYIRRSEEKSRRKLQPKAYTKKY